MCMQDCAITNLHAGPVIGHRLGVGCHRRQQAGPRHQAVREDHDMMQDTQQAVVGVVEV